MTADLNETVGDLLRRAQLEQRFWPKVEKRSHDQCWPWVAKARTGIGYGAIHVSDYTTHAHRVAWALRNGPIPDGLLIRHSCDNPVCCNPTHLVPGTQADNVRDMVERGRLVPRRTLAQAREGAPLRRPPGWNSAEVATRP